ncbi:UDP-glucosyltransferase 2-like [Oratosquilla oratoria]|uniref:UDP-glucosyltransferase 2-like n=1 Tax=Oratosquilla oratoria TaxID=337810 RepID=UPI003F7579BB
MLRIEQLSLLLLLGQTFSLVAGSHVLMVLTLGSQSHKNIFTPIAESLVERGHNVTVVSMHASSPPAGNASLPFTDLVALSTWKKIQSMTGNLNVFAARKRGENVNMNVMKTMVKFLPVYCETFLRDPDIQEMWELKVDLIMLPAFMNECGLTLVHKLKAPFIYVTTSGLTPWTSDLVGNPEHPAFVPNQYLSYTDTMSLKERTVNTLLRIASPYLRWYFIVSRIESVAQRVLKDSSVSLEAIERNVSMVFVNSHSSLGYPRPLMPNVIEVGGMQCRPARPLADPELEKFINSNKRGFAIFSLGTATRAVLMTEEIRKLFVRSLSLLPYNVLWKWEGEHMKDLPPNVMTRPYFPQQDLLGHPKLKIFISHGGLLSMQEAVYHGVPFVGIPLMSDQHTNMKHAIAMGIAEQISLETMTPEDLLHTVKKVVEDPSYRRNVKERSRVMQDQETRPIDRAVYWVEYVLRHKGAYHLRSTATGLSLSQYLLLDVAMVLAVASVVLLFALYFVTRLTIKGGRATLRYMACRILDGLRQELKID